jgi:hypothetical protein
MGRFISEDPISFGAGDVNLSRYVGNNPVNDTDPSGLEEGVSIPDIIGNIIVGIGAGVLWLLTRPKQPEAPQKDSQPETTSNPTPIPVPIPCDPEKPKKTCKEAFPKLIPCVELPKRYLFPSAEDARIANFPNGERKGVKTADKGPCSKSSGYEPGQHWNVKDKRNGRQLGSVGQCNCCEEKPTPHSEIRGAVLSSEPH